MNAANWYITQRLFVSDGLPLHHQLDKRVRCGLIILRYEIFYVENSRQQMSRKLSRQMSLKHVESMSECI